MAIVQVLNLEKRFGKLKVLDDLSFQVDSGKITAVLGPNASGKSTLIKCILGLVIPDKGEISIKGLKIQNQWKYRKWIGYMPQTSGFPDNLTLEELLSFLKKLRQSFILDNELFEKFGLESFMRRKLGVLSGGTKQKINAAISFLFSPEIFILDEPTVGLDPISSTQLKDKIKQEAGNGKTVVLTSHIMGEVEELCDEIIFLLEGKIFFQGGRDEIKSMSKEENLERAIAKLMSDKTFQEIYFKKHA